MAKKVIRLTESYLHRILREGEYPEEIGKQEDDNYLLLSKMKTRK